VVHAYAQFRHEDVAALQQDRLYKPRWTYWLPAKEATTAPSETDLQRYNKNVM